MKLEGEKMIGDFFLFVGKLGLIPKMVYLGRDLKKDHIIHENSLYFSKSTLSMFYIQLVRFNHVVSTYT